MNNRKPARPGGAAPRPGQPSTAPAPSGPVIELEDHHKRIVQGLQQAQERLSEAQGRLKQAEQEVADAQGQMRYYQGQLDLLAQFVQFAQQAPAE